MFLGLVVLSVGLAGRLVGVGGSGLGVVRSAVRDWVECGVEGSPTSCLEERTVRRLQEVNGELGKGLLLEVGEGGGEVVKGSSGGAEEALAVENRGLALKIAEGRSEGRGIVDEIGELFTSLTFKLLDPFTGGSSEEEENSENSVEEEEEESQPLEERGHKKKELKKKNKQLKLILLLMLLKNKIKMFVNKLQFLVQLKFLLVATVNMLANVIRLWIELKKKHKPSKVVYYENAHHQHHYDHEHVHDDDHHHYDGHPGSYSHHAHHFEDDDHGGGGIWPWSRSYVEKQGEQAFQRINGYGRYPGSHTIVYSHQRPLR